MNNQVREVLATAPQDPDGRYQVEVVLNPLAVSEGDRIRVESGELAQRLAIELAEIAGVMRVKITDLKDPEGPVEIGNWGRNGPDAPSVSASGNSTDWDQTL